MDNLYRFSFTDLPIRGQWVRLQSTLEAAGQYRTYPTQVSELLGQMLATVAMVADNLSVFASTTSAQLAGVLSDETGSGAAVFAA